MLLVGCYGMVVPSVRKYIYLFIYLAIHCGYL
jgi:hypothetical protein